MGAVDTIEWACVLCGRSLQSERAEQQICIRFCIKLEHSSMETIWMIQKAAALSNWWLAASSGQHAHSHITSFTEFFGETWNHPSDSAPLQPIFGAMQILAFPKTKIMFEREEISDHHWELQENTMEQLMAIERTVWGPKVPILKRTEVSWFYVQSFLYLVSVSINVSIFHYSWLDTFCKDLVYLKITTS